MFIEATEPVPCCDCLCPCPICRRDRRADSAGVRANAAHAARAAARHLGRLPPARQADRIRPYHGPPRDRGRAAKSSAPRASTTWPSNAAAKRPSRTSAARASKRPKDELIRFESEMRMGPTRIRTTGRVHGDRLDIETTGAGTASHCAMSIPWSPDCGGPFATEQTLLRQPMQPGERRTLKMPDDRLQPGGRRGNGRQRFRAHRACSTAATTCCASRRSRGWPTARRSRARSGPTAPARCSRPSSQAMGLETYRTTKAEALGKADVVELDLLPSIDGQGRPALARCPPDEAGPLSGVAGGRRSGGRVRHRADAGGQVDRRPHGRDHGLRDSARPSRTEIPTRPADPPTDDDLPAEQLHPERRSDDCGRREEGRRRRDGPVARGRGLGAVRQSRGEEKELHAGICHGGRGGQVAGRATAPSTRCSWRRLARARGIPARVAIGLVYMEGEQAFGYHMWTEVYIDKRWIPIDGTLALGGIGAAI